MKVIIDTPIWSLAFRKKHDNKNDVIINNLINLIRNAHIEIIGSIRQEVLSGISDKNKFYEIKNKMALFTDYVIQTSDYEFAAECSNECRRNGIQGSHTDFLICAVVIKNDWEIFTEDKDFFEYEKYLPIKYPGASSWVFFTLKTEGYVNNSNCEFSYIFSYSSGLRT